MIRKRIIVLSLLALAGSSVVMLAGENVPRGWMESAAAQRLYWGKIDQDHCIGCRKCVDICDGFLVINENKGVVEFSSTSCCIPNQAKTGAWLAPNCCYQFMDAIEECDVEALCIVGINCPD